MDTHKAKEFVEKVLKWSHRYNSLDNETDQKSLLKRLEVEVAQLFSNVGITCETSEIYLLLKNPLHYMCMKNKPEILHLFLLQGVDIEDRITCTPLHIACSCSKLENVQVLLYHGADTNARDKQNQIPLMVAINIRSYYIVNELWPYLDKYEIDHICTVTGKTLLIQLLELNMLEFAFQLLEMGPDVNVIDLNGCSALYFSYTLQDPFLFDNIFSRMSNLHLLDGFITSFFRNCKFMPLDFEIALFKILNSPYVEYIMKDCNDNFKVKSKHTNNTHFRLCYRTSDSMRSMISFLLTISDKLNNDNFIKVLYIFLSYGAAVEVFDYGIFLQPQFSVNYDVFDILIDVSPHHITLFTPQTLIFVGTGSFLSKLCFSRYSPDRIMSYMFDYDTRQIYDNAVGFPYAHLYDVLKYTAWRKVFLENFRDYEVIDEDTSSPKKVALMRKLHKILENNSVPSLLQIARDSVRRITIDGCKCTKNAFNMNVTVTRDGYITPVVTRGEKYHWCINNFQTGIRKLPIPQHLKDVLMLKVPIYNYDHLDVT